MPVLGTALELLQNKDNQEVLKSTDWLVARTGLGQVICNCVSAGVMGWDDRSGQADNENAREAPQSLAKKSQKPHHSGDRFHRLRVAS